ncbi:MAG: SDR family oxidoreductase [Solobacterium sp.]|nr:SDR family oxidoreductase [Solobacterium sp.]
MSRTVLVTGGTGGIGSAVVYAMAEAGYDVVIGYVQAEEKARDLQQKITGEFGVRCMAVRGNVADEEDVDAMITAIEAELGGVDILINNAGIDLPDLFSRKTAEQFRRVLDVNVVGAYNCAVRVWPHMKEQGYGRIINISSTNGMNTYYPMCFDYDASKAALNALTHDLAVQFAPFVHVNAVAPGFIGTPKELEGYDPEFLKQETEKILVQRYGKPEEVASLVRFLVSDEADYINNTIIRIDGGQMGSC